MRFYTLQALGLQRNELIQAMGIYFTVSTLALTVGLYFTTHYANAALGSSTLMLLSCPGGDGRRAVFAPQALCGAVWTVLLGQPVILLGIEHDPE